MTKQTIFSIIILILVIAGAVWLTIWAKSYKPVVNPIPTVTDSGESKYLVTKEPQMVSVAEDSYLLGVGGSYPQFVQADASVNKKIADTITTGVAEFKANAKADYDARLAVEGDAFLKQFTESDLYTYEVKTDVVQSNDNYISVVIHAAGFSGGAHGFQNIITFNYDVKNKKELSLTDFVTLEAASQGARASLKAEFEANGDPDTFAGFALAGTDPKNPENFQSFTFTPSAITLYFPEYQVAPYVYGEQQVVIPLSE